MPFPMEQNCIWVAPEIKEIPASQMPEALDHLKTGDLEALTTFEVAMTDAMLAKGIPFVFIQPGAPGHKEAVKAARKKLVHDFSQDAPYHPDHPRQGE